MMKELQQKDMRFPTRIDMIRYFLKGSTGWFMLSMFCMVIVGFLELLSPKIIQFTIDSVIDHQVSVLPSYLEWMNAYTELFQKHMIYIAFIVLMVALAVAILRYGYEITNAVGSQKLIRRMHDTMFAHLLRLPFSWYQENAAGDILQRSTSDCDTVQSFLAEQMTTLLQILFTITLATYYMFRLNVRMAIFSFLFLPLFLTYSLFFYKRVGNTFEKMDEEEAKLSSALESYNKSLLDKLNEQTKATTKVYDELKKFNERIDKEKKEQEELKQKKQEEEQTDKKGTEAILEELQNLSKVTAENGKQTETDEKIAQLVTKIEKDYEVYQFQSKVIIFFGIIVIPGIALFLFVNHLLKQFIF